MSGIEHTPVENIHVGEYKEVHITQHPQQGWYQYPLNTGQHPSCPVMEKIQELFLLVQQQKKWKESVDKSLEILATELIGSEWYQ